MLNIYFDTNYIKTKKVFFTKSIKYSKLINLIISLGNIFNSPIPDRFIFSGPHKRMNNILKTFQGPEFSINKKIYKNNYIVNFDENSEVLLKNLLKDPQNKILVGPLFNVEYQKKIIKYTNEHSNVKKIVASKAAYDNIVHQLDIDVKPENVFICPSGVISQKNLSINSKRRVREDKCLVYFKKRNKSDLKLVLDFLKSRNIDYELFEYGKYNHKKLIEFSKYSKFGIYISCSETQGFAIQEMMSCNLPLYVWDDLKQNSENLSNYYGGGNFTGTAASWWLDSNGIIVYNFEEFNSKFNDFISKLDTFKPVEIVEKYLTFEAYKKNLLNLYSNF